MVSIPEGQRHSNVMSEPDNQIHHCHAHQMVRWKAWVSKDDITPSLRQQAWIENDDESSHMLFAGDQVDQGG